jgi:hypothetical protein
MFCPHCDKRLSPDHRCLSRRSLFSTPLAPLLGKSYRIVNGVRFSNSVIRNGGPLNQEQQKVVMAHMKASAIREDSLRLYRDAMAVRRDAWKKIIEKLIERTK